MSLPATTWCRIALVSLAALCLPLRSSYIEKSPVSTYGELYASNNAVATGIALVNTWYQFTGFTAVGKANNTTPSVATDDITILSAGDYLVTVSISFSGAVNNVYELQVQKNGGTTVYANLLAERKLNPAGDIGVVEISGIADLIATDTVELWVRNTTGGNDATLKQANLTIHVAILGAGGGGGGGGGSTITAGTFAALPACNTSGDMYLFNDSAHEQAFCDGSDWHYYRDGMEQHPPVLASFGWINQGGATAVQVYGGIFMTAPAGAGNNVRLLVKAAPATPYTIDVTIIPAFVGVNAPSVSTCWRESGTGEIVSFSTGIGFGNEGLTVAKFNSPNNWNSNYVFYDRRGHPPGKALLRIADDGVNRTCLYSPEGSNWVQIHSVGRTDFLTPDQVGIAVDAGNVTWPAHGMFINWNEQ